MSLWSSRRLLLLYQSMQLSGRPQITLAHLLTPNQYPRSLSTASWEAFRTYTALTQLGELGVSTKAAKLNEAYYAYAREPEGACPSSPINFPLGIGRVNQGWSQPFSSLLSPCGQGDFIFLSEKPEDSEWNSLIAPQFLELSLVANRKVVRKHLNDYFSAYRKGSLPLHKSHFGFRFMSRLMQRFLQVMRFRQGRGIILTLGGQDEFLQTFKDEYEVEYELWKSGTYSLPFWDHLFYLEHLGELSVISIETKVQNHWQAEQVLGWNAIPIAATVRLELPEEKLLTSSAALKDESIHLIEVAESTGNRFFVYINGQYDRPVLFSRQHKSGDLIYTLTYSGFAEFDPFRRVYEYIQTDRRFKLFAQSGFSQIPILARDKEGYIVPAEGITFRPLET